MMSDKERERLLAVYEAHAKRFDAIASRRARAGIRSAALVQPVHVRPARRTT